MSEAIEKATGREEAKSYFNDHPYTPDRVKTIEQNASKIKWNQQPYNSDDFLMEFDKLLFGESPNKGVIRENQFLHPDLDFSIHFPKEWSIENQPTNVGAYHPDRKAAVYVSLEDPKLSPEEAGKLFIENMEVEYKKKMTAAEEYKINGKTGYLISFTEKVKSITMYAYILWVPLEDKLFKMTGITPIEYRPQLEETAKSLRVLKKNEKNSFTINLVRVVKARQGETIKTLSARTGNSLNDELTGVINSRNPDDQLEDGESIKVVIQYPYKIE
jgi:predicted Zn-dependent protease